MGIAGRLARSFLDSRLTPLVTLASLAVGVIGVVATPREEEPQISVPMIDVVVAMPGLPPGEAELLLMVAARAELVSRVIRPALAAGAIVLCDRYELSTRAYQGAGRGIPADRLEWLNGVATQGLHPDLTLIFDLAPEAGIARQVAAGKDRDRLDRESPVFHQRIAEFYRGVDGPGMVHLDAAVPAEQLADAAWQAVEAALIEREGPFSAPAKAT